MDHLSVRDREVRAVQVDGELDDAGEELAVESAVCFGLPLRDARACLAVWPRRPDVFSGLPCRLLETAAPHAALVLDNVRLAETLWTLSTHDGLTGLLNHRAIVTRLDEEVQRAQRYETPLSIVLCDIDRFKSINDTYGHPTGDLVLREIAQRLHDSLRSSDMVGRYGGEEFLVILPNSELEEARVVANRLCEALAEKPVTAEKADRGIPVTASFGVACGHEVSGTACAEGMVSLADTRLYEAKAAGRCCVKP
jgi:diguanylate cyclase (GGDEF)-like protein